MPEYSGDDRIWAAIDSKNHVIHRLHAALRTVCRVNLDNVTHVKFQEVPPRSVTCLLCLAES